MSYKQVMLEIYCGFEHSNVDKRDIKDFCINGIYNPGYHCLECLCLSYTKVENQLSFVGKNGEVSDINSSIGFGGEMEFDDIDDEKRHQLINKWEMISKKKIDEAYDEYMKELSKESCS